MGNVWGKVYPPTANVDPWTTVNCKYYQKYSQNQTWTGLVTLTKQKAPILLLLLFTTHVKPESKTKPETKRYGHDNTSWCLWSPFSTTMVRTLASQRKLKQSDTKARANQITLTKSRGVKLTWVTSHRCLAIMYTPWASTHNCGHLHKNCDQKYHLTNSVSL